MIFVGYPLGATANEIDIRYESETSRIWEGLNRTEVDPFPAIYKIDDAMAHIYQAIDKIYASAELLKGTAAEQRINSLGKQLEELGGFIEAETTKLRKEEC